VRGSRRGSRSGGRPEPSTHSFPPPELSDVSRETTEIGGTPDNEAAVKAVVRGIALSVLRLEAFCPDELLEEWGDNVKPAVDLLFRFGAR